MQLAVDIGFVASLLLLALGIERLLIRPHERQRIQAFFEELTVKGDDFRPATVVARLGTIETSRLLALVTYFWFCAFVIVTLVISGIITKACGVPTPAHDMHLARGLVCGVSLMLFSRWPVPQFLTLATSKPSRKKVITIAVVVFYGGSAFLLATMLLAQWIVLGGVAITPVLTSGLWTASALLELAFWPAYALMWLAVAPLTVAIAAFDRPALASWAIRVFTASLWRIVEYEKGALSALLFFAAFILGVLKLLYAQ